MAPRIQQLRHRQDQLQAARLDTEAVLDAQKTELPDAAKLASYVNELWTLLQDSSLAEQKAFIKSFVREIVVNGKEAVLRYTLPLPPNRETGPKDSEPVALTSKVLASVRLGGPNRTEHRTKPSFELNFAVSTR